MSWPNLILVLLGISAIPVIFLFMEYFVKKNRKVFQQISFIFIIILFLIGLVSIFISIKIYIKYSIASNIAIIGFISFIAAGVLAAKSEWKLLHNKK
jgi:membrane associated rhomboid family serine protease